MDNFALVLAIVGAVNWGIFGLFGVDLIGMLFGGQLSMLSRTIFTIIGLGGLWSITLLFKDKVPVHSNAHRD